MTRKRIIALVAVVFIWFGTISSFLIAKSYTETKTLENTEQLPNTPKLPDNLSENTIPNSNGPTFGSVFAVTDTKENITANSNTAPQTTNLNTTDKAQAAPKSSIPIRLPTGEAVPTTDETGTPNTLSFPKLKITSPILFASLSDLFEKNPDGTINTNKQIQEAPNDKTHLSTPVQRLLTKGIVHLGFTPFPGEYGNSYIVGHSSNYPTVVSKYNDIFKNLKNAKSGDIFTIYNKDGKAMNFKVFENIIVSDKDVDRAYTDFNDKRVVTLQASVLVRVDGVLLPLKRQLVRGELIN